MRKIDKIFLCGETLLADDLNEMIDQINEIIEYVSTHSGTDPNPNPNPNPDPDPDPVIEKTVKSFSTIILEFNDTGYYSPSIQSTGTTSQLYGYLNSMYTKAKEEYEGNSELFKRNTYSNLEILDYHGNNNEYEVDGTAENMMLYWIIAMCLAELVPDNRTYNTLTKLFKFAYDIGEEPGYGRKFKLYGEYTPKGDPIICRLVASVIYSKYRVNYKNYIPSFRSKLGGNIIPVASASEDLVWANALLLTENNNPKGNYPTNYGYTINLDNIFPAAAGPYLPEYSIRANNPKDLLGEDKDEFDETVGGEFELNYLVDKNIYNTAVSNYNIRTKDNFSRSVQAVADDCEDMALILGNVTYYGYHNSSDPTDSFYKISSGNNYFKGTFNADVVGRDLSGYIKTTNFTDLLEYTREAAGRNRLTTLDPLYGRKRPCLGNTELSTKWISSTNRAKSYLYDRSIDYILGVPGTYWDDTGHRAYKDLDGDLNYDFGEGSDGDPARWISANTYPSGHSSEIWAEAMMMIELFPNKYIEIYKAAYAYTVSRTIVRAHWNSDIIFGKLGATTIVPVLHAMSNFDTIYNNAVTALNNPPETGPSITINNNTGASAKITGEVYIITSLGMIYGYIENINGVPVNEVHKNSGYNVYTIPAGVSVTALLYIENLYDIPLGTSLSFDESIEVNSPIRVYGINSLNERNKSAFICSDPVQTTYGNFNYVINLTQGALHIIDIAYTDDFLTSPRLSGYKGTTFNLPTLYIKENNVIYVSVDGDSTYNKYPYWSLLLALLKYRFEQSTDTNYATLNSNGSVVLNNVTTGDGVRVGTYTEQNSMFNIVDSHFYISISEGTQNPFNVIIDNLLGETTYMTGEIYFFVLSNDSAATVYSYTLENILIDSTGDSMNRCKIELPLGESTFTIIKFETPPGTDYRNGIPIRNNVADGVTEYGVRVYGYGKSGSGTKYNNTNNSDHLKYAFKARVDKTSFHYNNTSYKITLYDKGIWYNDVWKNDGNNSSNTITVSQSSITVDVTGGTSILNVTSAYEWTATSNSPSWCTVSKSGNNLIITTTASSGTARQATISITNGYNSVTVTVKLPEGYLDPYPGTKYIDITYVGGGLGEIDQGTAYYNLDNPTTLPLLVRLYNYRIPDHTVLFSSSNSTVATVSDSGFVSPLKVGTTIIRAQLFCNDPTYLIHNYEGLGTGVTQYTLVVYSNNGVRADDDDPLYTVGLLSDIHYLVKNNREIRTFDPNDSSVEVFGNSSEGSSFFRGDLNKMIDRFKLADVKFVASCGDIATSDVNDLVEFTHDYILDWTGLNTYSGTSFLSNSNYRPFYSAIGNHDHFVVYSDPAYCKYINYGLSEHNGSRWKSITYNNTTYNCPELLAGTGMVYASNDSKSYYIIPSGYPNDMFIFLSAFYGDMLPTSSNPNYDTGHTGNKNDASQMHPHNLLNSNDLDVITMALYCNKSNIFTSGNETHMNFMYYKPSDLIWLKELLEANSTKRIFIFLHYFFPQKAGGGNKYDYGSNELMGLTFHFLNKLNNDYPKTIWFSGHSHFSWTDITYNRTGDIHYCNKDYSYIDPNTNINGVTDNQLILSNFVNANWYLLPSGTRYYDRTSSPTITNNATGWNVHLPSMSKPKESDSVYANCEGAILEVYKSHVEIYKVGYSTSTGLLEDYNSYSNNLYYRSLIVSSSDGSGIISGPIPGNEPVGNTINVTIRNNLSVEARFTGKVILNVSKDPNDWLNSTQVYAHLHAPQNGNSWDRNDIIIPAGGTYNGTITEITNVYSLYANTNFTDGTWYFMNLDNGQYVHSIYLYTRIWSRSKQDKYELGDPTVTSAYSGSNHMYTVTPLSNTILQMGVSYNLIINWKNPDAFLATSNTTLSEAKSNTTSGSGYYILAEGATSLS